MPLFEISQEVESKVVRGCVPEVILHSIIRALHLKRCAQSYEVSRLFEVLDEHITMLLRDEHRRDSDAISIAIIYHDHILHILVILIDDKRETSTCMLDVPHLSNKGTLATTHNDDGRRLGVRVKVTCEFSDERFTAELIVLDEPDVANDGVAVRSQAEVRDGGVDVSVWR